MTVMDNMCDLIVSILIHTSVKLVTQQSCRTMPLTYNFNPHEREARDELKENYNTRSTGILIHTSVKLVTRLTCINSPYIRDFNPHEREARDYVAILDPGKNIILIHTSVKLVTRARWCGRARKYILIHTSVKLVT